MAKDVFHEAVRAALVFDGWSITHDPLTIPLSKRNVFIDLGAEKLIAAQKGGQQIAVEVKSFVGLSPLTDFYKALGQYQVYLLALKRQHPDRALYLAMPGESYRLLVGDELLAGLLGELQLKYLIFEPETQRIAQWID